MLSPGDQPPSSPLPDPGAEPCHSSIEQPLSSPDEQPVSSPGEHFNPSTGAGSYTGPRHHRLTAIPKMAHHKKRPQKRCKVCSEKKIRRDSFDVYHNRSETGVRPIIFSPIAVRTRAQRQQRQRRSHPPTAAPRLVPADPDDPQPGPSQAPQPGPSQAPQPGPSQPPQADEAGPSTGRRRPAPTDPTQAPRRKRPRPAPRDVHGSFIIPSDSD